MKKKTVAIVLVLVLILSAIATTVVTAQDGPTPQQQAKGQVLFREVRAAVQQGLVTRYTASRIVEAWNNSSGDRLSHLYKRVSNMLESKKQQPRMESSLFGELDVAVRQGLITQEKAIQIKDLWQQKPQEECLKLYQRVMSFLKSGR